MQGNTKLHVDDGWDWLNGLLQGWGLNGWLLSLVKGGLLIVGMFLCIMLIMPCLYLAPYAFQSKNLTFNFLQNHCPVRNKRSASNP